MRIRRIRDEAQGHTSRCCSDRRRILQIDAFIQAVPRERTVHGTRVQVADAQTARQSLRDRGLARTGRPIDGYRDADAGNRVSTLRIVHQNVLLTEVV